MVYMGGVQGLGFSGFPKLGVLFLRGRGGGVGGGPYNKD